MATRDIKTKVTIEGESEYKAALKNINSEYKVLESGLKTITAEFQNNANSQEALTAKCNTLQSALDNQKAKIETLKAAISSCEQAQSEWKSKMDETKASLENVNTKLDGLSESTRSSGEQWNKYEDQLNASKAELENLKNSTGDTTEEQQKLESEITDLEGKMADLDESTGGTASETGALLREQESLGATLTEQEKKYDGVVNKTNSYQKQLNDTETKAYNLDAELQKNKQYLDEAKNSTDHCATSIDQYGKEVKSTTSEVQENNNALQETSEAFDSMAAMLTTCGITKAIKEITAALEECVNVAADFEYTMATVQAVSGATADEMSQLEAQAKEYGSTTVFMAQDVADAYTAMGRAGWDAGQMLDGMQGVMNLASASGEDLGEVTSIVTDALTAFGYAADDAGHFADVLAETAAESNTTVSLLGDSFGTVATSAGTLGYSIDDVSIALGAMANAGIKGQEAGTQLATAFTRMSGSNETATKQLDDWNVSMFDANGSAKDLNTFLLELRQAFDDNCQSEEDMMNAAYNLAGQKGMRGLLAIVNTSEEDWDSLTDSIYNCEGAAQEMSDIQLDTYTGQVKLLQSAMEGLELEIGSQLTPVLGNLAEAFANVISHFTDFIANNEAVVPALTGVTVALGAFAAAVTVGQVAVKGLTKAIQGLKGAAPIIAVISGIVGAIAAIATAAANSKVDIEEMQEALNGLEETQATFSEDQSILDLADQYYALAEKVESADLSEEELAETEAELESVKKKLEEATNGQVSAEESSKTAYEETLAALLELIEIEQQRAAQDTYDTLKEQSESYQQVMQDQIHAENEAALAADRLAEAETAMSIAADPSVMDAAYESLDNLRAVMFDSASTADDMDAALRETEQALYDLTGVEYHFNSVSDAEAAISELGMSTADAARQAEDAAADFDQWNDQIDELSGTTSDYQNAVVDATMNGIVPMDEAAEWLGVTTEEMTDMVEEATAAAEEEAKQAAETEAAIEAEREAAEAEAAAEEAAAKAQEEAAAALEAEAQAAAEAKREMVDIGYAAIDARTSGEDLRSTYDDLSAQFEELKDDCDEATVELVEQQLALLDLAATTQELSTKYGDMTDLIGISTEQLSAWLIDAGMSVEDFAADVDSNTSDIINDFEKMSTDLEMSIQDMADNLAYNIQATANWSSNITELWNAAVQSGQDGATEFVKYLYEMGPEAATQVETMCSDIDGTLSTFAPMFAEAASTAVDETALGLAMENGEVYDAAADMIGNAEDAVEDEDMTDSGEQKDAEIAAGISSNEKEVTSAMTDVCDATIQVWSSASSDFRSEGKNADTQIASGITSGQSSVTSAMSSVMASTKSEVSKISWTSLGYNISSGIAQGIKNGSSLITNAAKSAANTALNSAKSALGVSSPSKVFRDEVGAMIPAGMAEGITDNMQMVTDAVTKMSSSTVPAAQTQSISNTYNTYGSDQNAEILMVLQEYLPYLPSLANMKVVLDSGATVGGLATQMDRRLGQFATYRARGN